MRPAMRARHSHIGRLALEFHNARTRHNEVGTFWSQPSASTNPLCPHFRRRCGSAALAVPQFVAGAKHFANPADLSWAALRDNPEFYRRRSRWDCEVPGPCDRSLEAIDLSVSGIWHPPCYVVVRATVRHGIDLAQTQRVTTEMAREILRYFVRNPQAVDSLEGIARWRLMDEIVRRKLDETEAGLEWLVAHDYLTSSLSPGGIAIYRLNAERIDEARHFLESSATRRKRPP